MKTTPIYYHHIEQGSDEWHAQRRGMITASEDRAGRLAGPEHHPRVDDTPIPTRYPPSSLGQRGGFVAVSLTLGGGSEPCAVRITRHGI